MDSKATRPPRISLSAHSEHSKLPSELQPWSPVRMTASNQRMAAVGITTAKVHARDVAVTSPPKISDEGEFPALTPTPSSHVRANVWSSGERSKAPSDALQDHRA